MSTHEMAIVTVLGFLQVHLPDITIKRNVTLPTAIPDDNGLIIVRQMVIWVSQARFYHHCVMPKYYHHIAHRSDCTTAVMVNRLIRQVR